MTTRDWKTLVISADGEARTITFPDGALVIPREHCNGVTIAPEHSIAMRYRIDRDGGVRIHLSHQYRSKPLDGGGVLTVTDGDPRRLPQ